MVSNDSPVVAGGSEEGEIDSRGGINGPKQIVKVAILCCGRYRDGNRVGGHGNAAGSFVALIHKRRDGRTGSAPLGDIPRRRRRSKGEGNRHR